MAIDVTERIEALPVPSEVQRLLKHMMWLEDSPRNRIRVLDLVEQLLQDPLPVQAAELSYPALRDWDEWRALLERIFVGKQYYPLVFSLYAGQILLRTGDHVPKLVGLMVRPVTEDNQ